jgi:tRNA-specific adenosine deaminase 3
MLQTISLSSGCHNPKELPIAALLTNSRTSEVLLRAWDIRISTGHPLNHPIMLLLKELPSLISSNPSYFKNESVDEQYYANMCDIYITHEPCIMCCMALVHSRIRRLIFWREMPSGAKALGWMKENEEGTLNHRYMCFEGIEGALPNDVIVKDLSSDICA